MIEHQDLGVKTLEVTDDRYQASGQTTPAKSPRGPPKKSWLRDFEDPESDTGKPQQTTPEKVKSRWTRYSQVEEVKEEAGNKPICHTIGYEEIIDNLYLWVDKRKRKKQNEDMQCECDPPSKDDILEGIKGCGDDCINRMLQIECNRSQCKWKDLCSNQRFSKHEYPKTETFDAGLKGKGLKALEDIYAGGFIIEYVGEVIHFKNMHKRLKEYKKQKLTHHYLLQLSAEEVVDATRKGNRSRFINHSCDPNCKTDKWTVNGAVRIGFFAIRSIKAGEEITFDYKFERFGGTEQKCYCKAGNCRGVIGQKSNLPTEGEIKQQNAASASMRRDEKLTEIFDAVTKFEQKCHGKLRRKEHVLQLSRFMLHADTPKCREILLEILKQTTELACLRSFLDFHGLKLLWSLAVDPNFDSENDKLEILEILEKLPILHKTGVRESRIIETLEKWKRDCQLFTSENELERSIPVEDDEEKMDQQEGEKDHEEKEESVVDSTSGEPPEEPKEEKQEEKKVEEAEDEDKHDKLKEKLALTKKVTALCDKLLAIWNELNEEFKIPKKTRKKSEEEAEPYPSSRSKPPERETLKFDRKKDDKPEVERYRRTARFLPNYNQKRGISKEERRRAFEEAVKQEELRESMNEVTPVSSFKLSGQEFFEVNTPRTNLPPVVQPSAFTVPVVYAGHQVPVVYGAPTVPSDHTFVSWNPAPPPQEPSSSVSNFEERLSDVFASQGTPPSDPRARPKVPPPPPKPISISKKLPKSWKIAHDGDGTPYYYNIKTKETRWSPPPPSPESTETNLQEKTKEKEKRKRIKDEKENMIKREKKFKDKFKKAISAYVVHVLNPYHKTDCKQGRIKNNDDFKTLARKLTHLIMMKELKHCRNIQDLEVNLDVKSKAKSFIETYMQKFDKEYKPDPSDKTTVRVKSSKSKTRKERGKLLKKQVESTETSAGEESSLMMPDSSISPSNITKNDSSSNTKSEEINNYSIGSSDEEDDEDDDDEETEDNDKNSSAQSVNSPTFNVEEVSVDA
ncbi:DgyrCDS4959 [Dimorphilus gyrociliatus]|uniref:[histone H3]-lysine(36) N-trimethyltransferase n=1 Tax=Dimorphilus gyrociliatus TaxID=2664684 RepID=A0A7I8VI99_9ANNE|nr:DgyrCDS4959 [Dimorphilus gyrociliatus]